MALFYFGKTRVFMPKLIGSFLEVLAIVMFVAAAGNMFDSWDAMAKYPKCVDNIKWDNDQIAVMQYIDCRESLYRITGMQLRQDQPGITTRQFAIALLRPVGDLLLWATIFLVGAFLYNTRIVRFVPKEEKRKKKKG